MGCPLLFIYYILFSALICFLACEALFLQTRSSFISWRNITNLVESVKIVR